MAGEVSRRVIVRDAHFEYLRLQKGSLFSLCHDRERWHAAYELDLWNTFSEIRNHLPPRCWGLLDIGSGLGGIDVLLNRHYGDDPYIHLLDGENDAPEMRLHRQTFNSMKIARDFLTTNGVRSDRFGYFTTGAQNLPRPYDLVISLGSWCFHYEPDTYLPLLLGGGGLHVDSVVIVDVRNGKVDYDLQLGRSLECVQIIRRERKYTRAVYRRTR